MISTRHPLGLAACSAMLVALGCASVPAPVNDSSVEAGYGRGLGAVYLAPINDGLEVNPRLEAGSELVFAALDRYLEAQGIQTQRPTLPVHQRNYTRLILLMPGTSSRRRSQSRGTGESGTQLYSVNGGRPQDNNYTLDGIDSNRQMMNSPVLPGANGFI